MEKYFYTLIGFFSIDKTFAADDFFWTDKIEVDFKNNDIGLLTNINNIAWYIIGLLYFIAVVFAVYWWFKILTSWWDDEKVKKWKNIIIYVIIWLIVIFLASQFIHWIMNTMDETAL